MICGIVTRLGSLGGPSRKKGGSGKPPFEMAEISRTDALSGASIVWRDGVS